MLSTCHKCGQNLFSFWNSILSDHDVFSQSLAFWYLSVIPNNLYIENYGSYPINRLFNKHHKYQPRKQVARSLINRSRINIQKMAATTMAAKSSTLKRNALQRVCTSQACEKCSKIVQRSGYWQNSPILKHCQHIISTPTCCHSDLIMSIGFWPPYSQTNQKYLVWTETHLTCVNMHK